MMASSLLPISFLLFHQVFGVFSTVTNHKSQEGNYLLGKMVDYFQVLGVFLGYYKKNSLENKLTLNDKKYKNNYNYC